MGKKSRTKHLTRDGQGLPGGHGAARGQRSGFGRMEQLVLIGVVAAAVLIAGVMVKSAFTSPPSSASPSASSSNMSSMNTSSSEPGIKVGKRVAMADMALPSSNGRQVALSRYRGKKLVVYFYEGVT